MQKLLLLSALILVASNSPLRAIILTSFDDFSTGTEGWIEGGNSPNPPTWTSAVGWDGSTTGHLINLADGAGSGGKLHMWNNNPEWQGDYVAAGVSGIEFWTDNRSGFDLNLRIGFDGPGGWFSSNAQVVSDPTGGNDWTKLIFQLDELNFSYISGSGGSASFSDTIKMVSRFEIFSSSSLPVYGSNGDILRGDQLVADIRFDSIAAIPESKTTILTIGVIALFASWLHRKKTRHTLIDA